MRMIEQLVSTSGQGDFTLFDQIGTVGYSQYSAYMLPGHEQSVAVLTDPLQGVAESVYIPGGQSQERVIKHEKASTTHETPGQGEHTLLTTTEGFGR